MKRTWLVVTLLILASMVFGNLAFAQEGQQLVVWADDTRAPILAELGAAFQEEYDIEVVVQEMGFGDIRDNLRVAGPAGEGPDVLIGAHDWLGELVSNGLVAPIDLGDNVDLFLPAAVQAFTFDGQLYGMPYAAENIAFFINPDLVEACPATWDEVAEISREIVDAGEAEYGWIIQTNDPYHFMGLMSAFGGYVFGVDDTGSYVGTDVGIDSEGSVAAAGFLSTMATEGLIPTSGVAYDEMHTMFESGDAAMMMTGPWALPRIRESGTPYQICAIPGEGDVANGSPFLGVQGFMISAFSENQLLAQAFLQEYVATEETMQAIFDADPRPSAFLPVREAIADPDIAAFAAAGEQGMPMPAIPEMSSVWTAWGNAQQLVIQGQEPEQTFSNAAAQIRSLISGEPTMTVAETMTTYPQLSALINAITMGEISVDVEGPVTFLAPNDAAITAYLEAQGMEAAALVADPEALQNLLMNHMVEGELTTDDIAAMETLTTLAGNEVTVTVTDEGIMLNDTVHISGSNNIRATDGIMHIVEGVLALPAAE